MNEPIAIIGISSGWRPREHPGDIRLLDADLFDMSAQEAQLAAPPHRLLLESAWEALEAASYHADEPSENIGIYASINTGNDPVPRVLPAYRDLWRSVGEWQMHGLTSVDLAPLWVSHKLKLNGPAVRICAGECSPIAALHMACQALRDHDCDLALAGAIGILEKPYGAELTERHRDWRAGVVLLRRYADAIEARDCIYALIRCSAFTRSEADRSDNAGRFAMREVLQDVLRRAGIQPETLARTEVVVHRSHLDPAAVGSPTDGLQHEAGRGRDRELFSGAPEELGSLQSIAALIDTTRLLAQRGKFSAANATLPRRAAIVAIGSAGTSAHVVLEEAPSSRSSGRSRRTHVLCLSAKSEQALQHAAENLRTHLAEQSDVQLADVAYSLQIGRRSFGYRRAVVCGTASDAREELAAERRNRANINCSHGENKPVVFMFPGAGAQYVRMARDLYESERAFREVFNQCCDTLRSQGVALESILYPDDPSIGLTDTVGLLVALFAVEYSLARLWMDWGVQPESMIGHSVGEYVAACLSGVFSLEDALKVVAFRGHLFEELAPGAMLGVAMEEAAIEPLLDDEVSLAAVNAPGHCVISGSPAGMQRVQKALSTRDVETRLLTVARAGHSALVAPILGRFAEFVGGIRLGRPRIPYISNYTGTWIKDTDAMDPQYWATHLRHTVRFSEGIEELLLRPERAFLEVGPGRTLGTFVGKHKRSEERVILSSMRHVKDAQSDVDVLLRAFGGLWAAGARVDFHAFYSGEQRQRLPLPTYPFQRRRYWIEATAIAQETLRAAPSPVTAEYADPHNHIEEMIRGIWRDVLGVERPSMDQRFCDLGGSEPLLQKVQDRLRQEFGVSYRDHCRLTSTISGMADLVAECALEEISDDELSKVLAELEPRAV